MKAFRNSEKIKRPEALGLNQKHIDIELGIRRTAGV